MNIDKEMQRALERAIRVPPPPGLLQKLLAIPAASSARGARWQWLAAPAALAAIATVALVLTTAPNLSEQDASDTLAAEAAIRDFTIAMVYLQKTTEIAGRHTGSEISNGMVEALALSRGALPNSNENNGG